MSLNIGKLEDKALQRKERLLSLKRKFDGVKSEDSLKENKAVQ